VTFGAGLRQDGLTAPFVIDRQMNAAIFIVYLQKCLVPTLRPGAIVNMDKLPAHKVEQVRQIIEAAGAALRYATEQGIFRTDQGIQNADQGN
jgi:hypothetical protein